MNHIFIQLENNMNFFNYSRLKINIVYFIYSSISFRDMINIIHINIVLQNFIYLLILIVKFEFIFNYYIRVIFSIFIGEGLSSTDSLAAC